MIHLTLASTSPRRAELLTFLGLPFDVRASQVSEDLVAGESPANSARRLALKKAQAVVSDARPSSTTRQLVLGADTVVADGTATLGKPRDSAEAVSLLRRLRGRTHEVTTGVALVDAETGSATVRSATTLVQLRNMTDEEISDYVASGDPFDKAGGYAIQNRVFRPVASIEGCYSNVMGLPLCVVSAMIRDHGEDAAITRGSTDQRCTCATFVRLIEGEPSDRIGRF